MLGIPLDVWAMMLFSVAVFFGVSIWALVYSLLQEERKMKVLSKEGAIDTHSPKALLDLKKWIHAHPNPETQSVVEATNAYKECVSALQSTNQHFYDWSPEQIQELNRP